MEIKNIVSKINKQKTAFSNHYVEREQLIETLYRGIIGQNNVLLLGPPGTAKSEILVNFTKCFEGFNTFFIQLMKSTKPDEVFGPFSIKGLKNDRFERITDGKMPDCEIIHLDEVYHCGSSLLQGFNEIMNERTFGGIPSKCEMVIGATNYKTDDIELEAFHDRWAYKVLVEDIEESCNFIQMLKINKEFKIPEIISREELSFIRKVLCKVKINDEIFKKISVLRDSLMSEGITLSPRRWRWVIKSCKVEAILNNRLEVQIQDIIGCRNMFWDERKDLPIISEFMDDLIAPYQKDLKKFLAQAKSIKDELAPLNPDLSDDTVIIHEGLTRLKTLESNVKGMIKTTAMNPQALNVAEIVQKQIHKIRSDIWDSKF